MPPQKANETWVDEMKKILQQLVVASTLPDADLQTAAQLQAMITQSIQSSAANPQTAMQGAPAGIGGPPGAGAPPPGLAAMTGPAPGMPPGGPPPGMMGNSITGGFPGTPPPDQLMPKAGG